jgi:hypothetical protein
MAAAPGSLSHFGLLPIDIFAVSDALNLYHLGCRIYFV